jgi:hypothetical protein
MRLNETRSLVTSFFYVAVILAGQAGLESEVGAVFGELSGQVKDICGRVIPGATVTLVNESGTAFRVITDGEGRYVFHGVASTDGSWVLGVEAKGFENERLGEIRLRESAPVEQNIRLSRDLTIKESLLVTHADPNIRFRKYSVIGIVTNPNGSPVSGATVTFRTLAPADGMGATDRCSTDELGRYYVSLWHARSARWILSVESQDMLPYVQSDLDLRPDEARVIKISLRPR